MLARLKKLLGLQPTTTQATFNTFLQGLVLGVAEIIPGVSGSTIAVLFGIYDDFIELLFQASELAKVGGLWILQQKKWRDVTTQFQKISWKFGITLGVGMVISVIALSSLITVWLASRPALIMAILLGLTFPTIGIVYRQISKPSFRDWIVIGVTTVALATIFATNSAGTVTNPHPLHLFIGGLIAISAMILPGVSGSFMLLVMGLYTYVVGLVSDVAHLSFSAEQLIQLASLGAGLLVGFITTVRVLRWAFKNYRNTVMSILVGLLLASWYVLWPLVTAEIDSHGEIVLQRLSLYEVSPVTVATLFGISVITGAVVHALHTLAEQNQSRQHKEGFDRF